VDVKGMNAGCNILDTKVRIVWIIKDLKGQKSVLLINYNLNHILATALRIQVWSVIQSQSPISISLVSFQRNVAKEIQRTRTSIEI